MILVDHATKFCRLIPCHSTLTTRELSLLFKTHWHDIGLGIPQQLVTDRDPRFTSKFWKKLTTELEIQHDLSTARHQQTNGQVERTIRTIKTMLLSYINYKQSNWTHLISSIEFAYNDTTSASTGFSPFFLTFGKHPTTIYHPSPPIEWSTIISKARDNLIKAQKSQDRQYNKNRKAAVFSIGQRVLLKRDGINWEPDSQRSPKLLSPWLGPFKVIAVTSTTVTLELPPYLRIHPVFAFDKIKLYHDRSEHSQPSAEFMQDHEEYEVRRIIDHRLWHGHRQFLIEWKHLPPENNQWLFEADMINCQQLIQAYLSSRGGVREEASGRPIKLKLKINNGTELPIHSNQTPLPTINSQTEENLSLR
jgi:hypothetical protein